MNSAKSSDGQRPTQPPPGKCPNDRETCPLTCKYNHFEGDDLTIDAWEIRCLDCGWRDTIGFRSDEMDEEEKANCDPKQCPFCSRDGMKPGKAPCEPEFESPPVVQGS